MTADSMFSPVPEEQELFEAVQASAEDDEAEESDDGSITQRTFSGPNASTAIVATIALSTPPDRPSNTFPKRVFRQ